MTGKKGIVDNIKLQVKLICYCVSNMFYSLANKLMCFV